MAGGAGGISQTFPVVVGHMDHFLPFLLLFSFLLQVPSRHVEECFSLVHEVVGDGLVFDWGGRDGRRGRRGSGFEGDDRGVWAEGSNGDGALGLRSKDFWGSWRESGVPHLVGVVLEGEDLWRSDNAL